MKINPIFSIIMACHNAGPYIKKSIRSVLDQSFSSWELIIVDDASTDESLMHIKEAVNLDSRIKYIANQTNLGAAAARNLAVDISSGKWIAILDADDLYMKDKLKKQYEIIEKNGANLVLLGTACVHINEKDEIIGQYNYNLTSEKLKSNLVSMRKFPPHSSLVYSKNALILAGGFNTRFKRAEDFDLWLRIRNLGEFHVLNLPLVGYRLHSTNISKKKSSEAFDQIDYAVASIVSEIISKAGYSSPINYSNERWINYLKFIHLQIEHCGYNSLLSFKNNLKMEINAQNNMIKKFSLIAKILLANPLKLCVLMKEYMLGSSFPWKIFRSWRKMNSAI